MMLDKMQVEKIINLNKQLNEDIGKLQIENDVLLVKNNLLQKENEQLKAQVASMKKALNLILGYSKNGCIYFIEEIAKEALSEIEDLKKVK